MKFLEEGKVIEKDGKRVRLSELELSKESFDSTLGSFNKKDLQCGKLQKEAINQVLDNGFSDIEERNECIQKMMKIESIQHWIQDISEKISNIDYNISHQQENNVAINFVNSMNELKIIKDNKENFKDKVGFFNSLKKAVGLDPLDNLNQKEKNIFTDSNGKQLTEEEIAKKEDILNEKIKNHVVHSKGFSPSLDLDISVVAKRLYKQKQPYVEAILKNLGKDPDNIDIEADREDYLKIHEGNLNKLIEVFVYEV